MPPKIIGITGGIGSGKTTFCKLLESEGYKVYYADERSKWLLANDPEVILQVRELFGDDAYRGKVLNRSWIAQKVFSDNDLLDQLNAIAHPVVAKDFSAWVKSNRTQRLLFKEAALLFETGAYKGLDKNILVTAGKKLRIRRILRRDLQKSRGEIENIMSRQMDESTKRDLSDMVIQNNDTDSLIEQLQQIRF